MCMNICGDLFGMEKENICGLLYAISVLDFIKTGMPSIHVCVFRVYTFIIIQVYPIKMALSHLEEPLKKQ